MKYLTEQEEKLAKENLLLQDKIWEYRSIISRNPYTSGWSSALLRQVLKSYDNHFGITKIEENGQTT